MRERIFQIIEVSENGEDRISSVYDAVMLLAIIISIIPLAFKEAPRFFYHTDIVTTILFIIDYFLRLMTADYKLKNRSARSFIKYPFTPIAIIDLISILPSLTVLNSGFKLFRLFRIFKTFRIFRVFKAFRYSKSVMIITNVIKNSKDALMQLVNSFLYFFLCIP